MRLRLLLCAIGLACIGCDEKSEPKVEVKIEWHQAGYGLKDYKEMQPGRPILAIFIPEWSSMCEMQRRVLKDKTSMGILEGSRLLCLMYDCTDSNSLGMTELERMGRNSLPAAVFIDGFDGKEQLLEVPCAEEEVYKFLHDIKVRTKRAEFAHR